MPASRKSSLPKVFDLPLIVATGLTVAYYLLLTREPFKDSLLAHYTSEHTVEYIIVGFLIWGLTDTAFRAFTFPGEMFALKQPWLPSIGRASRWRTRRRCSRTYTRSPAGCKSR